MGLKELYSISYVQNFFYFKNVSKIILRFYKRATHTTDNAYLWLI
jgi:hypothetical protein